MNSRIRIIYIFFSEIITFNRKANIEYEKT